MTRSLRATGAVLLALVTVACGARGPLASAPASRAPVSESAATTGLPASLVGAVRVLAPEADGYARAEAAGAVRPPGEGNVSRAVVVRLTRDVVVFRLWNGPTAVDAAGRTNRIGSWWAADAPTGTRQDYRRRYEICQGWNALAFVATCTLKAGAVVAVGPGNSVSAQSCGDPTGAEAYPPNVRDWQVYVARAWERLGPGKELECPDVTADYEAEPADLSRPIRRH